MIINVINNTLRLGSFHYENVPFSMLSHCPIWKNRELAEKLLTDIINLFDYVDEYQFDNHHEIYKYEQNYKILKFIKMVFEKNNVSSKLIFVDNNLSHSDNNLNLKGIPAFLGLSYPNNKIIEPRKFNKKFLYLNRVQKTFRTVLFEKFKELNVLKECNYSFNSENINLPNHKQISAKPNTFSKEIWNHHTYDIIPEYLNTFCNIVTETNFGYYSMDYLREGTYNCVFITEKTEKCFAAGIPFVMVSTPYFLKKLKELGFKTFDKWWDESYDLEEDPLVRLDKITEVVSTINSHSIDKLESMYEEMLPILKHNQDLNNTWYHQNKKTIRYFYKFETAGAEWMQYSIEYVDGNLEKTLTDRKFLI